MFSSLQSLLLSELDKAAVVVISHPEAALLITGNSSTIAELARECVNKSMVRTEDPQTVVITILTDGNVACSIDGNACRTVESTSSIAGQLFSLWHEDSDAVGAISSNVKTALMVKSHSPGTLLAREGVGKAVITIEHMDQMFAVISYVDLPFWVSADTLSRGVA